MSSTWATEDAITILLVVPIICENIKGKSNKRTPCHTDDYTKSYKSASEYLVYAISPPEKYNGEEDLPDKKCLQGNKRIFS